MRTLSPAGVISPATPWRHKGTYMKRPAAVATAALVLALGAGSPSSAQDSPQIRLEPGLWTFKYKATQDGFPGPDKTESRCFTEAEFGDPVTTFLEPVDKNRPCTENHSVTGRTLSFTGVCKLRDGTEMTMEGTFVFEDTRHFSQSGRIVWTTATEKTETTLAADARLAGPCPK